jgi:hypothetical protein
VDGFWMGDCPSVPGTKLFWSLPWVSPTKFIEIQVKEAR